MKPEDKIQYKISINEMLFKTIELAYKGFVVGEQGKYLKIVQQSLASILEELEASEENEQEIEEEEPNAD
jgi:hypothetical protein